jgi:hypothetical protein
MEERKKQKNKYGEEGGIYKRREKKEMKKNKGRKE